MEIRTSMLAVRLVRERQADTCVAQPPERNTAGNQRTARKEVHFFRVDLGIHVGDPVPVGPDRSDFVSGSFHHRLQYFRRYGIGGSSDTDFMVGDIGPDLSYTPLTR